MQVRRDPAVGGRVGINARHTLSSRHAVATGNLPDDVAVFGAPTAHPGGMVDHQPASRVGPAVALGGTRVDDGAAGAGVNRLVGRPAGKSEIGARMESIITRTERTGDNPTGTQWPVSSHQTHPTRVPPSPPFQGSLVVAVPPEPPPPAPYRPPR